MQRQCDHRFAASTIHTALHSTNLPSLGMVEAIVTGCRGSEPYLIAFKAAWRRLAMSAPARSPSGVSRRPALYPVSKPA
jgi:hypothetical protein